MKDTVNIENGKVHFWLKDEKFKSYLQYMNLLYQEKLLWKDYYKRDLPAWRSNLSNALFGAFYMPYSDVFLKVEDQFTGFVPLVGPYGDQLWSDANSGVLNIGAFAISNVCKDPEVAIRWVDYFYSEEGSLYLRYGIEGETYTLNAQGKPVFVDSILKDPKGFMTALGQINLVPGGGAPQLITNDTDGVVASDLTKEVSAMMVPYLPKTVYMNPSFTQEESEEYVSIVQDLYKYRDEAVTKFILGEWDFKKWNEYCTTLDKIGLPKLEKLYQQAFDRLT
jgi:putative aldouronate transport system substrate-binding protein